MAVSLRLRATRPPRGYGAFNPVPAETPMGATGGAISRYKTAVYGTVPVPVQDITATIANGIEAMVRRNTVRTVWFPTWSVLRPNLVSGVPRPPLTHPVTFAVGTSVGGPGGVAPQPRGRMQRRTGGMQARVTVQPNPIIKWKTQGSGPAKRPTRALGPGPSGAKTKAPVQVRPAPGGPSTRNVTKQQRNGPTERFVSPTSIPKALASHPTRQGAPTKPVTKTMRTSRPVQVRR